MLPVVIIIVIKKKKRKNEKGGTSINKELNTVAIKSLRLLSTKNKNQLAGLQQ